MRTQRTRWRYRSHWSTALAGLVLVLAACGGQPASQPTPTPTGTDTASPAPSQAYQVVYGDTQVQGRPFTLYDSLTGQSRLIPVSGGPNVVREQPQFAGGDRLSYLTAEGVVSQDLAGGSRELEAAGTIVSHAWSAAGVLAYVASANPVAGSQLVIQASGRAPVTMALPPYPAAMEGGKIGLQFSPDGGLLLVDAPFGVTPGTGPAHATVQVWGIDGRFVFAPPVTDAHDVPTQAAWGTDGTLYYSAPEGVMAADPRSGSTRQVLPATRWGGPSVAPDGRHIAFGTIVGDVPQLHVLDTTTGSLLAGFERRWAVNPRYVTASRLWFNEAEAISQSMTPFRDTDRVVSYDVAARLETRMPFTALIDGYQAAARSSA